MTGYVSAWGAHTAKGSLKDESMLAAYELELGRFTEAVNVLEVGVGNGGGMEVLAAALPEGSTVTGVDVDERCAALGLPVHVVDAADRHALTEALRPNRFHVIADCTHQPVEALRATLAGLWPMLLAGGTYLIEIPLALASEDYEAAVHVFSRLAKTVHYDRLPEDNSLVPHEELLRVSFYANTVALQKRHARVMPYMTLANGTEHAVTSMDEMQAAGAKKVLP